MHTVVMQLTEKKSDWKELFPPKIHFIIKPLAREFFEQSKKHLKTWKHFIQLKLYFGAEIETQKVFSFLLGSNTIDKAWAEGLTIRRLQNVLSLGPVCRKSREHFGPVRLFSVHLYLKTEKCMRLKLPCMKRTYVYIENMWIKQL